MSKKLTLSFVTGTQPGKWFDRYREHIGQLETVDSADALADVISGRVELGLARLPESGTDQRLNDEFHHVRLYEEAPGVAVPKDHLLAELGEEVRPGDIEDEIVNYRIPESGMVDVQSVRDALQIVAANVGVAIAPRPLLKVLSKRQVVPLALADAPSSPTPRTYIALVWKKDADCEEIQSFVAISRGRTGNSSRGTAQKLSAREKSLAKLARRQAAAKDGALKPRKNGSENKQHSQKQPRKAKKNQSLPNRKGSSGRGKRR